jgi:hypothetical protein
MGSTGWDGMPNDEIRMTNYEPMGNVEGQDADIADCGFACGRSFRLWTLDPRLSHVFGRTLGANLR